jgi:signal transduction histidine kinase
MADFSRGEIEHAVWDLQSPLLANADLGTALTHVAGLISPGTPQVTVDIVGTRRSLPSNVEHHLLRIGQEAITNAVRHARAKNVRVTLDYNGPDLRLSVKDDGGGFVDAANPGTQGGHFGLHGIRMRARKIQARLDISSRIGEGTTLVVQLSPNPKSAGVNVNQTASA